MDSRKESSDKLLQQLLNNCADMKLGSITPAMRRLQGKYLSGQISQYDFMVAADSEVQNLYQEKLRQQEEEEAQRRR